MITILKIHIRIVFYLLFFFIPSLFAENVDTDSIYEEMSNSDSNVSMDIDTNFNANMLSKGALCQNPVGNQIAAATVGIGSIAAIIIGFYAINQISHEHNEDRINIFDLFTYRLDYKLLSIVGMAIGIPGIAASVTLQIKALKRYRLFFECEKQLKLLE
jgi:hypothetical protein